MSSRNKTVNVRSKFFATTRITDTLEAFDLWCQSNPNFYIIYVSSTQNVDATGINSNILTVVYSIADC